MVICSYCGYGECEPFELETFAPHRSHQAYRCPNCGGIRYWYELEYSPIEQLLNELFWPRFYFWPTTWWNQLPSFAPIQVTRPISGWKRIKIEDEDTPPWEPDPPDLEGHFN